MENKEMNDAMGSRRLLPPLYPGSPTTTTNVPRAGNSHHQNHSRRSQFQHNPAATARFASQAGSGSGSSSYQQPPSPLSRMTHASAGVGGSSNSNTVSQEGIFFGSGYAGGSSSSPGTGLASVVGLAPLTCTQPPLSWPVDQASSGSGLRAAPLLTQSRANNDLGLTDEYVLPPLPASLVGQQAFQTATVVDLEAVHHDDGDSAGRKFVQYVDLEGSGGPDLNTLAAARYRGNNSTKAPCLPLASPTWSLPVPAPADRCVKKEVEDWSSWGTMSQLGNNSIASGGSSSAWIPQQPYSSSNTGNGIITKGKAPWTPVQLTPSSSIPAPAGAADVRVKKEAIDWSWKNTIASGGSSSANNDPVVLGSKRKLQPSLGTGWGSGAAGSSSRGRGVNNNQWTPADANAPFIADFADGLFTQNDIDKIIADKGLASIVLTEPKRVRSILKNRSWSEMYRQRRIAHLSDLERQAERLQQENNSLSARVQSLQSTVTGLTAEKNEMMIKLYGFQQEMQLKNDMNKTLNAEVHRLKLILGESMGSGASNSSGQERGPQMMQPEHPRKHNHQLAQLQQEQELQELDNFIRQ